MYGFSLSLHWYLFIYFFLKNKNQTKNSWWIEILVWMGREKHELPQACKEPFSPQKWICMLLAFSRSDGRLCWWWLVTYTNTREREEREKHRIVRRLEEKTDGWMEVSRVRRSSIRSPGPSRCRWCGTELTDLSLSPLLVFYTACQRSVIDSGSRF
jgi:hypothetical protein